MPILDLQRRIRQLGEIRIGHVVDTGRVSQRTGKPIMRPKKLDKFRFTSPSKTLLEKVAALYGGEVKPWTPANGGPSEYELFSEADRLPVLMPPRDAVSQWYELYKGSKCIRRCDGRTEQKSGRNCMCDSDPQRRDCAMTTRVNVMLQDVPALGQWLLISKGYYAAVTLPDAAEVLALVGGYVPGWLGMEEKLVMRDDGPARFMVPTIDVEIAPSQLMAGQIAAVARSEVTSGPQRAAIEAAKPQPPGEVAPQRDFAIEVKEAKTAEDALRIFQAAKAAGMPWEYLERLKTMGQAKPAAAEEQPARASAPASASLPAPQVPAADEVVDAEIVPDDDPTEVWFQIIAAAGSRDWTTEQVEQKFAARYQGLAPASASVGQLREFLAALRKGDVA